MDKHALSTTLCSPLPPHPVFLDKNNGSINWAGEDYGPVALIKQWTYLHLIRWTSVYLDAETCWSASLQNHSKPITAKVLYQQRQNQLSVLPASSGLLPSLEIWVSWTYLCPPKCHTGQVLHLGLAGSVLKPQWHYLSFWRFMGMFRGVCSYLVESAMAQYNPISMTTSVAHGPTPQILAVCQRCKLLLRTRAENKWKAVPSKATTD